MLNEKIIKQFVTGIFVTILLIFVYLIIKPIFFAMIFGFLLAYIFTPVNKRLLKKIKNETLSALITCVTTLAIITLGLWFLIPTLITQMFEAFNAVQLLDVVGFFRKTFPFLFTTPQIAANFEAAYSSFISTTASQTLKKFTEFIFNLPSLSLKLFVALITFFYGLRDGHKILEILRKTLPFGRSVTNRFIEKSKQVTFSVIYGRIIVGILTGLLTGLGFYAVGIDSAILLTFLAILASIIPIIGPWIIWIPVVLALFITDRALAGLFLLLYGGVIISLFEHIVHPMIVSKTSKIPTSITIIGMIGGMLVFGIFGIILGPLIMAYLVVLFDLYMEKNVLG